MRISSSGRASVEDRGQPVERAELPEPGRRRVSDGAGEVVGDTAARRHERPVQVCDVVRAADEHGAAPDVEHALHLDDERVVGRAQQADEERARGARGREETVGREVVAVAERERDRDGGDEHERREHTAEAGAPPALGVEARLPEDEQRDRKEEGQPLPGSVPPEQRPVHVPVEQERTQHERRVEAEREAGDVERDEHRRRERAADERAERPAREEIRPRGADVVAAEERRLVPRDGVGGHAQSVLRGIGENGRRDWPVTDARPTPARRAAPAAALGIGLFLVACLLPRIGLYTSDQVEDVRLFQTFGERFLDGEIPYRDFFLEYPPGALPSFVLPALAASEDFTLAFKLLHVVFGCGLVALVSLTLALLDASRVRLYAATGLDGADAARPGADRAEPLRPVARVPDRGRSRCPDRRTESARPRAARGRDRGQGVRDRPAPAGADLRVAAWRPRRRRSARSIAYAAAAVVVTLPFAVLGPGGLKHSVWIHLRRGLHIESLAASVLTAADRLGLYTAHVFHGFAVEIDGTLPTIAATASTLVQIAALIAVWVVFARGEPTRQRLITASAAAVTAFVVFGKVLSPQFMIWLVPLAALAPGVTPSVLVVAAAALTRGFFPERYGGVTHVQGETWLVLARNLVLVGLFAVLLRLLAREAPAASAADP